MNKTELNKKLDKLLSLPNETEWVEFKKAESKYSFDKLGKYFSALSNEANLNGKPAGWLVMGVNEKHDIVGTNYRNNRGGLESLKNEISQHTALKFSVKQIHELKHEKGRVLLFEIPPAPHGVPMSWQGHHYGRDGESLGALNQAEYDAIRAQSEPDWSADIVEEATIDDLDKEALLKARDSFKKKNSKLSGQVDKWDDTTFLNKAKITRSGKITRAALLLLGKGESTHHLLPADVRITWVLKNAENKDVDYEHFGPPFLLNTEEVFKKIRNVTYRLMPNGTLFPIEILKYDPWVVRELLHNCIAHQDYTLGGRVNVVERDDNIALTNLGLFIPYTVECVIEADSPPDRYRNPYLAVAMAQLNMIDTIGSGIPRVFQIQKERGFPMPDFDLSKPGRVAVTVLGKVLDENFTRLLLGDPGLKIKDVIALDKVQKRRALSDSEFKALKQKKLVEGRRPNIYVSAKIAKATDREVEYILESGFDDSHYKELILKLVREFGSAKSEQINKMLMPKLPDILDVQKKKHKVRNLLQEMAKKDGSIHNAGGRGKGARWELSN